MKDIEKSDKSLNGIITQFETISKDKINLVAGTVDFTRQIANVHRMNRTCNFLRSARTICCACADYLLFSKISKMKWKSEIGNISDEATLTKNLEENCIPQNIFDMTAADYDEFLTERRKLMAKFIEKYYKNL